MEIQKFAFPSHRHRDKTFFHMFFTDEVGEHYTSLTFLHIYQSVAFSNDKITLSRDWVYTAINWGTSTPKC